MFDKNILNLIDKLDIDTSFNINENKKVGIKLNDSKFAINLTKKASNPIEIDLSNLINIFSAFKANNGIECMNIFGTVMTGMIPKNNENTLKINNINSIKKISKKHKTYEPEQVKPEQAKPEQVKHDRINEINNLNISNIEKLELLLEFAEGEAFLKEKMSALHFNMMKQLIKTEKGKNIIEKHINEYKK